jgi:hypothetical protein
LIASACGGDDSSVATEPSAGTVDTVVPIATEAPVVTDAPATTETPTTTATATESVVLPIGDGRVSTTDPQVGWVYTCVMPSGGGGAFADGPWIDNETATWDPSLKVKVSGSVTWNYRFSVTVSGDSRTVDANNLPMHETGVFPIARDDEAFNYDRNPNAIAEQDLLWVLPSAPVKADEPKCLNMGAIGFMTTGSVLFNALDGEGRDAAAHETLDNCDGHPERTGEYHYHNFSECNAAYGATEPTVVGWAADGFPIVTGLIDGRDATNADLDVCHGRDTSVVINGETVDTYAYWMTAEYPYSLGCYWGTEVVALG